MPWCGVVQVSLVLADFEGFTGETISAETVQPWQLSLRVGPMDDA